MKLFETSLPTTYVSFQNPSDFIAQNQEFYGGWNYNGYSINLAREMMAKQTSKHKVIVFIGDGGYDDCEDDYKIPYPEVDEANAARKEGIRILYLGIGEWLDPSSGDYNKEAHDHALLLAGGEENYIQIADFNVNLHCLFVFI
ncbi:hypothetical protein Y032_0041g405 [Ancylostoma ceylanicum]|uniref:VWFA domain-containing protein n=1 Tax=Ancylostoma ceylanicum TaxID=53326 RepID=A0A016UFW0_9BILA|nr:hypothetical protein Y032_0041g405 [Ancylostoma ceylanicum]